MRVLQQLIKHFWQHGALTVDQAHYFVEHGFVRPEDLDAYEPRATGAADEEGEATSHRPQAPVLLPDELDRAAAELEGATGIRRKPAKPLPRAPDLEPEVLGQRLDAIRQARAEHFAALVELARPDLAHRSADDAPVVLRQMGQESFQSRLLRVVDPWPTILGALWECVDDQPFHDLVAEPGVKGRAVRAFEVILRAHQPGEWGAAAWVLQVPAVQVVSNLLAVRRRLIPAVIWLYENHWARLAHCLQRPARAKRSWDGLGHGLVLVYNARARVTNRPPPGYVMEKRLSAEGWRAAWAAAIALDPAPVVPYFIQLFGGARDLSDAETEDLSARADFELICPGAWKI